MEIKKVNPKSLPKEYREVYDTIKKETQNFRTDYLELLNDDGYITEFVEMIKEDYPEAMKVAKPTSSPTLKGKPKNVTQLKKWMKENVGEKIYIKNHPKKEMQGEARKISKAQTSKFETERENGKKSFLSYPKASEIEISDVGFTFTGSGITFVYDKKDAKPVKPKPQYSDKIKKRLDYLKKKYPDLKSQMKGRSESDLAKDLSRKAKKPGKRKSASGKIYYENRPDHSDLRPRTRLKTGGNVDDVWERSRFGQVSVDLLHGLHKGCVDWNKITQVPKGDLQELAEMLVEVSDQVDKGYLDDEIKAMTQESLDLMKEIKTEYEVDLDPGRNFTPQLRAILELPNTLKSGGRLKSALMRDRKYVSDEEWEKRYHNKRGRLDTRTGYKGKKKMAMGGGITLDPFFAELYWPYIMFDDSKIYIDYKSGYNYDLSIEFVFGRDDLALKSAKVVHEIKEWEYDLKDATDIGGFEDSQKFFDTLKKVTSSVLQKNGDIVSKIYETGRTLNIEGSMYYDTKPLESKFKQALKSTYNLWGVPVSKPAWSGKHGGCVPDMLDRLEDYHGEDISWWVDNEADENELAQELIDRGDDEWVEWIRKNK